MSNFSQDDQNVGRQFNAGNDINNKNKVSYYINNPFAAVKELIINVSGLFQNILPEAKNDNSQAIQFYEEYEYRIQNMLVKQEHIRLKKASMENDINYQKNILEYKDRFLQLEKYRFILNTEMLKLETAKFEHDKLAYREMRELTSKFYADYIESKKIEIQNNNDRHYLNLQVAREDIISILYQDSGKFLIIPSPPEISCEDIPAFNSLKDEISYDLEKLVRERYSKTTDSSIDCKNIFIRPIEGMVAKIVGKEITPVSTLIFNTKITYENVIIQVTITCPKAKNNLQLDNSESQFLSKFIPQSYQRQLPKWNWKKYKNRLEAQGEKTEDISKYIVNAISTMHSVVTLCFCDLYCFRLNPHHSPYLFSFLQSSDFPELLRHWAEDFRTSLEEAKEEIRAELEKRRALRLEQERLRALEYRKNAYTSTTSSSEDFTAAPLIVIVLGMLFLIPMCSLSAPNTSRIERTSISSGQFIVVNKTNGMSANIRTGPSTNYEIILEVPSDFKTSVKSIDEISGWIEIDMTQHHPSHQTGWIAGNLVTIYENR